MHALLSCRLFLGEQPRRGNVAIHLNNQLLHRGKLLDISKSRDEVDGYFPIVQPSSVVDQVDLDLQRVSPNVGLGPMLIAAGQIEPLTGTEPA